MFKVYVHIFRVFVSYAAWVCNQVLRVAEPSRVRLQEERLSVADDVLELWPVFVRWKVRLHSSEARDPEGAQHTVEDAVEEQRLACRTCV